MTPWLWDRRLAGLGNTEGGVPASEWSLVGNQQGQAASGGWHQLFADV